MAGRQVASRPEARYFLDSSRLIWIPQTLALSRESLRLHLFPHTQNTWQESPHPGGEGEVNIGVQAGQTSATHLGELGAQLPGTGATPLPPVSSALPGVVAALRVHRAVGGGGSPRADPKSDQLPLGPESQIWTTGGPGSRVGGGVFSFLK